MGSSVNFYAMIFKKIIISVIILFSGCAGPTQFATNDNWAESMLKRLTLREKTVSYTHLTLPTTPYV